MKKRRIIYDSDSDTNKSSDKNNSKKYEIQTNTPCNDVISISSTDSIKKNDFLLNFKNHYDKKSNQSPNKSNSKVNQIVLKSHRKTKFVNAHNNNQRKVTEFFRLLKKHQQPSNENEAPKNIVIQDNSIFQQCHTVHTNKRNCQTMEKSKTNVNQCPPYKIVQGTKFAVDAFKYGCLDGIENYFLTHFHCDHYIGLTKKFSHKLYVSEITGRLVKTIIKLNPIHIKTIRLNTPTIVDNIEVTALDANHCPGAVMFLFKLQNGECILHTGDFRADATMESYPEFWNNHISTIYLDTTYLSNKYDFQSQQNSLEQAINVCQHFLDKNNNGNPLIVCGSYVIGKEKIWMEIAQNFDFKVWLEPTRRRAVNCYENILINKHLVDDSKDARIHVLPLAKLRYNYLSEYLDTFSGVFTSILAIRPSGWEKNSKPSYGKRISIVGISYSEHSSYSELKRFVKFIQPTNVISTVPLPVRYETNKSVVPLSWLNKNIKEQRKGYQLSITNFCTTNS